MVRKLEAVLLCFALLGLNAFGADGKSPSDPKKEGKKGGQVAKSTSGEDFVIIRNPNVVVKKSGTAPVERKVDPRIRTDRVIVDRPSNSKSSLRRAWERFMALNGPRAANRFFGARSPRQRNVGQVGREPGRAGARRDFRNRGARSGGSSTVGPLRNRYGFSEVPRLSLPIGLPSLNIVHVPGFTYTSDPRIEYRTIGAPAPGLGPGNLVPARGQGARRP